MPAILFDVDDTLYDLAEPYRRAVGEFFGDSIDVPLDELFRLSRIHSDEAYELVLAGKKPVEYMHVYRVQRTFADFGIDVSPEDALAFQKVYERYQGLIAVSDEMRALLSFCVSSGWKIGIITNGDSAHQWGKVDALDLYGIVPRNSIVISGDVGACKPDERIFRVAEELIGAKPGECWFAGDTYECDVIGALGAGWHCIWFNRRGRMLSAGELPPDIEVSTEAELISAVKEVVSHGV